MGILPMSIAPVRECEPQAMGKMPMGLMARMAMLHRQEFGTLSQLEDFEVAKKANLKKVIGRIKKASAAVRKSVKAAPVPRPSVGAANLPKAKLIGKIKTPFGKAELEMFREMLLDKRRALIGDMNGIEAEALRTNRQEGSGDLSNMPTHPADIGTDNFEQEFTLGLLESERTLLSEINSALERIDNNTYGVCLGTGQPIGAARLKARPWAYSMQYFAQGRARRRALSIGIPVPRQMPNVPSSIRSSASLISVSSVRSLSRSPSVNSCS